MILGESIDLVYKSVKQLNRQFQITFCGLCTHERDRKEGDKQLPQKILPEARMKKENAR